MAKCLNPECNNKIISQLGKREKKTCSDSCRQKVWQRNKQESNFVKVSREEWESFVKFKKGINNQKQKEVLDTEVSVSHKQINTNGFRERMEGEGAIDYSQAKRSWHIENNQ